MFKLLPHDTTNTDEPKDPSGWEFLEEFADKNNSRLQYSTANSLLAEDAYSVNLMEFDVPAETTIASLHAPPPPPNHPPTPTTIPQDPPRSYVLSHRQH